MLSSLLGAKVLLVAAATTVTVGGTATAAYTSSLPDPLQRVAASTIGAPHAKKAKPDKPAKADKPENSTKATPVGPDAKGPARAGLCNAWSHGGLGSTSTARRNLAAAAGGEAKIGAFCGATVTPKAKGKPSTPGAKAHGPKDKTKDKTKDKAETPDAN